MHGVGSRCLNSTCSHVRFTAVRSDVDVIIANILGDAELLGIGLLGSIQNLVAASIARSPAALGIHIKRLETIKGRRVAEVLRKTEEKYPLLGTALLDVFFPGSLRIKKENTEELASWRAAMKARYEENAYGIRLDRLPAEDDAKIAKENLQGEHIQV